MAKLLFDAYATHSSGLSHGAVYFDGRARPWVGLTAVASDESSEIARQYLDGEVRTVEQGAGLTELSITAYTYPEELEGQTITAKQLSGLTYRTSRYLHLVYDPFVYLEGSSYQSDADTLTLSDFTFRASSLPVKLEGQGPVSHLIVDLDSISPIALDNLEDLLYGTDTTDPVWPTIEEVVELVEERAVLRIIDNRDGTWTAIGPESAIKMVSATEFEITWPSAQFINANTFQISSL